MANVSVNFDILKDKHPSYRTIRSLLKVPSYVDETCCVQLSYALNRSGAVIENYAYENPFYKRKVRAFKGNDNMFYIIEVSDMRYYLDNRYGNAENYNGSKQKMIENIKGRHGMLAFGYRHIDLWVGDNIHRPSEYLMDYLWTNDSLKKRGIFFWGVTSEEEHLGD
jgi:hypothetical protein